MCNGAPRVLIVDREARVRECLERVVRTEGCEAVVTPDGNEALARVADATPDLIFLGVQLPGLNGLEVLKRLRSDPETAAVPVIMLPEKLRNLEANRWQWEGSDGYLVRPPSENQISVKVRWFLRVGEPARRILIVDDEAHICKMAENILRGKDYLVDTVGSGQEALERLARGCPDLLILDVMMPRMDGFEVLSELRAEPATADLPVLMLSGSSADPCAPRARRDGSQGYLTKPFSPAELTVCVREMLGIATSDLMHPADTMSRWKC